MLTRSSGHSTASILQSMLLVLLVFASGCSDQWHQGPELKITTQPADRIVPARQTGAYSVAAVGIAPLTYQWFVDGHSIDGAESPTYVTPLEHVAASGTHFSVRVTDAALNTVDSSPALLTVTPIAPNLTITPIATHSVGDPAFQIDALSPSNGAITYSVASGSASLSGSWLQVNNAGPVVLNAAQVAQGDYTSGSASTSFMVDRNIAITPISPANQTMGPGELNFTATATGGSTNALAWTATGSGNFVGSHWTSPDAAGQYEVTATSVEMPTKSVSTHVTVSPPVITVQPVTQAVCPGAFVTFAVTAMYGRTYQWMRNGQPISGAVQATFTIGSASDLIDVGDYTVAVSNPAGTVTSIPASLSVGTSITTNPSDVSVPVKQTATFNVEAKGIPPFLYQWSRLDAHSSTAIPIPGAVANVYMTPPTGPQDDGSRYSASVHDACGTELTSTSALLTVTNLNAPPTIITQPSSQAVQIGATPTMTVVAIGSPVLTYQWYRVPAGKIVGTIINGATAASYLIPAFATTTSNDQDAYYVTVTNPYGTASSQQAIVTVGTGIAILKQPTNLYLDPGQTGTFNVLAQSTLPLTYQWFSAPSGSSTYKAIPSAIGPNLALPPVALVDSSSTFYVVVSNGVSKSVQSSTAALFVGDLPGLQECGWNLMGTAIANADCSYQLTASLQFQAGEIIWPSLVATDNLRLAFTVTLSKPSDPPADGFAFVLGDPSLGATLTSTGMVGEGLGARGIPGLVLAFDDWENNASTNVGDPQDPQVPYLGVGRGESDLWENPYFNVNTNIPPLAALNQSISHAYIILLASGNMTVMMDGIQVFTGPVKVPQVSYLYVTASTGWWFETTVISNISATVAKPLPTSSLSTPGSAR